MLAGQAASQHAMKDEPTEEELDAYFAMCEVEQKSGNDVFGKTKEKMQTILDLKKELIDSGWWDIEERISSYGWTGSIKRRTPLFCWAKNTAYRKKMKKKGKRNMNKKDDFELFAYSITESYNNCKKFLKEEFGKEGRKKLQKKAKGQKAGADA